MRIDIRYGFICIGNRNRRIICIDNVVTGAPLFNGNIASMMVSIPRLGITEPGSSGIGTILYGYRYDQLNRLVGMNAYKNNASNTVPGTFSAEVMEDYKERISYDPNGNILSYLRNGTAAAPPAPAPGTPVGQQETWGVAMDQLTYKYQYVRNDNSKGEYIPGQPIVDAQLHHLTNRLSSVDDAVTATAAYKMDLDDQNAFNYTYDRIGNLISDTKEHISTIEWTVYGKIRSITKDNGSVIEYLYDVAGNRISKTITPPNGSAEATKTTLYVRDASGNVMAVYERDGEIVRKKETHLYGSSRIGMATEFSVADVTGSVQSGTGFGKLSIFTRHEKIFELSNHLGNVLVTVSDKRIPYCPDPNTTVICGQDHMGQPQACHCSESPYSHFYRAEVMSANDYYPFGMGMVGRSYSSDKYRYGFNGKENDNEVKGEGNQQDYGMRIYDPRLGRFLSVDPIASDFPWNSVYAYAEGDPINYIDLDGMEKPELQAQQQPQRQTSQLRIVRTNPGKVIEMYPKAPTFRPKFGWSPFALFVNNLIALKQFNDDLADYMEYRIAELNQELATLRETYNQLHREKETLLDRAAVAYDIKAMATTEREEKKERKEDAYLYRGGSFSDANFTPREKDTEPGPKQGLSTFVTSIQATQGQGGKVQVLSVKKLLKLGFQLNVTLDGHVGIVPKSEKALKAWAASREAVLQGKTSHLLTKILKKAWVKEEVIKR